MCKCLSYGICR